MDCKCKGKFWVGLGMGAVLGVIAYHCSRTAKAKELKNKMCCAAQTAAEKAGEWMTNAKERAAGECACSKEAEAAV